MGAGKKQRGFTLLEMAVVMTITGLLVAAFLQFYEIQLEKTRIETTKQRLDDLRTALSVYVATYNKLPCPADPAPPPGAREDDTAPADSCDNGNVDQRGEVDLHGVGDQDLIKIGTIPLRDLNLSEEQATDGWGHLFSYAVTKKLTKADGMRGNPAPAGVLKVIDGNGHNLLDKEATGRYVILSHGRTGKGSWAPNGTQIPCDRDALDGENCNGDSTFVIAPFSLVPGKNFFDDLIIHDDVNVRGSMLDKLIICNSEKAYYNPSDGRADSNGCARDQGVWNGACMKSFIYDANGKEQPRGKPSATLPPATASATDCSCSGGFQSVRVGAWDDGTATITAPAQGGGSSTGGAGSQTQTVPKHTALYTCTNQ